ncbi:MAG: hypothetical protein ACOC9Y_06530 [Chloroflexota bacterium]
MTLPAGSAASESGLVVWLAGLVIFGIAIARGGVLPVWVGVLIATSQLFAVAGGVAFSPIGGLSNDGGDYTGAIGHAFVWFLIGRVLWTRYWSAVRTSAAAQLAETAGADLA